MTDPADVTPKDMGAPPKNDPPAPKLGDLRKAIVDVLEYTYGAWLVVLIFTVFLLLDPSTEVLIGFIADLQLGSSNGTDRTWSVVAALSALTLLPILAHASAAWTLRHCDFSSPVAPWMLPVIPVISLFGYAVGFARALRSPEAAFLGLDWLQIAGTLALITLFVGAYLILYFFWSFARAIYDQITNRPEEVLEQMEQMSGWLASLYRVIFKLKPPATFKGDLLRGAVLLGIAAALLLGMAAYVGFVNPSLARLVGPIGIVACFGIYACGIFAVLTVGSNAYMPGKTPLILIPIAMSLAVSSVGTALLVAGGLALALIPTLIWGGKRKRVGVIVFGASGALSLGYALSFALVAECGSLAGCNMMRGAPSNQDGYQTIADTLRHLPDAAEDTPMRIVAAQGGGLYAAYHTAYYLAARADTEPGFTRSLYALSGVSGGSVGAGVYWAIRTSDVCPTPGDGTRCHRDAVDDILRRDYLTPSVATLLFRDFLDTFLPISAIWERAGQGPIDRGHVLENELLSAVATQNTADLTMTIGDSAYVGRQTPDDDIVHPFLFFNSTRVDNGAKAVVSPIATLRGASSNVVTDQGFGLRVINGMVNSARFPGVTPPARVAVTAPQGTQTVQLVDGAYFDNSGIETALDVILDLHAAGVRRPMELIVFTAEEVGTPPTIKGTLGAPVAAFTAAWRARRDHSAIRVEDVVRGRAIPITLGTCRALADAQEINFTVSWYLSAATFDNLRDQINKSVENGQVC